MRVRYSSLLVAGVAPCQIRVIMRNSLRAIVNICMSQLGDCARERASDSSSTQLTEKFAQRVTVKLFGRLRRNPQFPEVFLFFF